MKKSQPQTPNSHRHTGAQAHRRTGTLNITPKSEHEPERGELVVSAHCKILPFHGKLNALNGFRPLVDKVAHKHNLGIFRQLINKLLCRIACSAQSERLSSSTQTPRERESRRRRKKRRKEKTKKNNNRSDNNSNNSRSDNKQTTSRQQRQHTLNSSKQP